MVSVGALLTLLVLLPVVDAISPHHTVGPPFPNATSTASTAPFRYGCATVAGGSVAHWDPHTGILYWSNSELSRSCSAKVARGGLGSSAGVSSSVSVDIPVRFPNSSYHSIVETWSTQAAVSALSTPGICVAPLNTTGVTVWGCGSIAELYAEITAYLIDTTTSTTVVTSNFANPLTLSENDSYMIGGAWSNSSTSTVFEGGLQAGNLTFFLNISTPNPHDNYTVYTSIYLSASATVEGRYGAALLGASSALSVVMDNSASRFVLSSLVVS